MSAGKHRGLTVLVPLIKRPDCEITEVDRHTTTDGCTVINYRGVDGNDYHEFIADGEATWFATKTYATRRVRTESMSSDEAQRLPSKTL